MKTRVNEDGIIRSYFLDVKMSCPTMYAVACSCSPNPEISVTLHGATSSIFVQPVLVLVLWFLVCMQSMVMFTDRPSTFSVHRQHPSHRRHRCRQRFSLGVTNTIYRCRLPFWRKHRQDSVAYHCCVSIAVFLASLFLRWKLVESDEWHQRCWH